MLPVVRGYIYNNVIHVYCKKVTYHIDNEIDINQPIPVVDRSFANSLRKEAVEYNTPADNDD